MKSVLVFVFALCAVAFALPTERLAKEDSKEEDAPVDTELFIVPLERSQPRRPVFPFDLSEDLVPPPFEQHPFFRSSPWGSPSAAGGGQVDDFMTQIQEMLKEMRKQLTEVLHRSHTPESTLPDDSSVGTRIGEDDLPKNKSTSTTKVIDGHVVTVNETTYSSGDDNIGAVFRIKVVEVKPSETPEDEEAEDKTPESEEKPESEESSPEAVLPEREPTTGKSELEADKHEETNEIPNQKVYSERSQEAELDPSNNEIDQAEVFAVDEFSPVQKEHYYDLSGDTKVNQYLADQEQSQQLVMMDPDAEFVEVNSPEAGSYYHYDRVPQRLESLSQ